MSKGYRRQRVKLSDGLAGIDANLADVQAGAEACSRAVDMLVADTARRDGQLLPHSPNGRHCENYGLLSLCCASSSRFRSVP